VTYAHFLLLINKNCEFILLIGIIIGIYFTFLQKIEYNEASFSMRDSLYGRIFFITTGFHGLHVLIGTIFLSTCFFLFKKNFFSQLDHLTFEFAI
jgi:heme/copper-type cytochrome/quinol oxidase subunit 3